MVDSCISESLPWAEERNARSVREWTSEGMTFVSVNANSNIIIPPYSKMRGRPTDLLNPGWSRDGYLYMAFMPMPLDFRSALLQRLNVDAGPIPISGHERGERFYCKLDRGIADSWLRLSEAFTQIVDVLLPRTGLVANIRVPPRPKCKSLFFQEDSRQKSESLVLSVRSAFLPWIALISFCIALLEDTKEYTLRPNVTETHSRWVGELLLAGVHPGWIGMLVDSPLSWFAGTRRLGVILHLQRDFYSLWIETLVKHNVPVIYGFESVLQDILPFEDAEILFLQWFRALHGPSCTVSDLREYLRRLIPARNPDAIVFDDGFDDTDAFPHLDANSGQKAMESREEFFVRREMENMDFVTRQTDEECRRIESRRREAESLQPPAQGNLAKVFEWVRVGKWEIRTKQSRSMYEILFFDLHEKEEIKFDAVRNEWDLWYDRQQTEELSSQEIVFDEEVLEPGEIAEPDRTVFARDLYETTGVFATNDVRSSKRTSEANVRSTITPLHDMLKKWYGFTSVSAPLQVENAWRDQGGAVEKTMEKLSRENRLKAVLVDSVSSAPEDDNGLVLFVACLIVGSRDPLKHLCDMRSSWKTTSYARPIKFAGATYSAKPVNYTKAKRAPLYEVIVVDRAGRRVKDRDGRRLFFWDATTAVAAMRLSFEEARSISHVAEFLVRMGAGFLMPIARGRLSVPYHDFRVAGLGRRWRDYQPDRADVALYFERCSEFFSIRRSRRALRCGGILWRIAKEFIGEDEALDGPLYEASNEPLWLRDERTGREDYVEDGMSITEVQVVIGSFELRDRESRNEPVFVSYWPPPWIWESSGYHVGYWTPDCEDWFVNRLHGITNGTKATSLLNTEEWKSALKRFQDTKKMITTVEKECCEFLNNY